MPRILLDLDRPPSWPAELLAYLDEHHDLFLEWETWRQDQVYAQLQRPPPRQRYGEPATAAQVPDRAKILGQAFDKAIYGLRDILPAYEILGWHCTRLTDAETDEILRDGMGLPNVEMLARRIDALEKAQCDRARYRAASEVGKSSRCRKSRRNGVVLFFSSRER